MPKTLSEHTWKYFLPDVYLWADKVRFTRALSADGINVVPVRAKNGDSAKPTLELVAATALAKTVQDQLLAASAQNGWQGKGGAHLIVTPQAQKFLLVPLTQTKTTPVQVARQWGIDVAKACQSYHIKDLVLSHDEGLAGAAVFEGLALGYYDPALFKTQRTQKTLEQLPATVGFLDSKTTDDQLAKARDLAKATALTRMIQDAPANYLTPERFGEIAAEVSKELGITCKLLGRKELQDLGAGSFLSVAAGSVSEPRLIVMEINGKQNTETIALIGKGLTFDSGGISIKPSLGMGEMKYDMSGGAAVLGTAYYLAKQQPRCRVICLIGAVENMVGPTATRPGDIIVAMNGKSIDVQNTDAEGRLVLADVLHYANSQYQPKLMVDIATLTGAVLHALGHAGAAVMSNDQSTADLVLRVSKEQGEPFWQLPLWPELEKETKGEWSDLQNIAKPNVQAGTIMGGHFLAEFVGTTKWAHLDIAGTGWSCKATGFPGAGGSAFGLRTLAALCS